MNRFQLLAANDSRKLTLAALCLFTLEPPPIVYYGTEIAIKQEFSFEAIGHGGDAQARGDMVWDQQQWNLDVLAFFRAAIRLRREQPALRYGGRQTVWLSVPEGTYGYRRSLPREASGDRTVLVAFNLGQQPCTLSLPAADAGFVYTCLLHTAGALARLSSDAGTLNLAPCSGMALGYRPTTAADDPTRGL
jgi:glycosidase